MPTAVTKRTSPNQKAASGNRFSGEAPINATPANALKTASKLFAKTLLPKPDKKRKAPALAKIPYSPRPIKNAMLLNIIARHNITKNSNVLRLSMTMSMVARSRRGRFRFNNNLFDVLCSIYERTSHAGVKSVMSAVWSARAI